MEWRKNLYQFEVTPPANAWDNIRAELESDVPVIRKALTDYAEEPPALVWEAITKQLDLPGKTSLVWYRRPAYVTLAAASVAAIVFLFVNFYTGRKDFSAADVAASVYKPGPVIQPAATSDPVAVRMDNEDENYIYLVTKSGEVKRVSYKLEKMVPEIMKQDGEKFRKWSNKIEASAFIPAGNNFFDIAEMIRILGDEKP